MGGIARDMTFVNKDRIEVDGGTFVNCDFRSAILLYGGGEHPKLEECTFGDVGWHFEGAALRTIQLLQLIGGSAEGQKFIKDLFQPGKYLTE
ncbi:MAG: hypothetical protein QOJ94_1689 [Sphingomonadales bacterium]|nr:hypothetical protein [Sphingomonadales bacterium]